MQQIMEELAQLCGFYFEATTFSQLFFYLFMGFAGTAILCSIIRAIMYMSFHTRRLVQ